MKKTFLLGLCMIILLSGFVSANIYDPQEIQLFEAGWHFKKNYTDVHQTVGNISFQTQHSGMYTENIIGARFVINYEDGTSSTLQATYTYPGVAWTDRLITHSSSKFVDHIEFYMYMLIGLEGSGNRNRNITTFAYSNLTIEAYDNYTLSKITNFSAIVNGTTYSTTDGQIETNLSYQDTLINITIISGENGGYLNRTYTDHNLTKKLYASIGQSNITVYVDELVTEQNVSSFTIITPNKNYTTSTGSVNILFGAGTNEITVESTAYYDLTHNITVTANETTSRLINITNSLFELTLRRVSDSSVVEDFNLTIQSTTYPSFSQEYTDQNTSLNISLINGTYRLIISSKDLFTYNDTETIAINESSETIYLFAVNSLNISFFDESTGNLITGINISLDLISDVFSDNYITDTGQLITELLIPSSYTMRYSASGYEERFYYVTVTNNSYQELSLYMIQNTTATPVTITVIDQNADAVEGALVKALKYDIDTNSYLLQEIGQTDFTGSTILSLTLFDEYYKFIVEYNEETLTSTNPSYLTSTTYSIQVIIGEEVAEKFYQYYNLDYDLTFNNQTNNFRLTYNDVGGIVESVCLYVYDISIVEDNLINNTCLSTASGTILLGIPVINDTLYRAKAYYYQDGERRFLSSLDHYFGDEDVFGNLGLLFQIFITVIFALVALWKIELAAIMTPLSLLMGRIVGFNHIGYEFLIPLMVVGIIVALMLGRRG